MSAVTGSAPLVLPVAALRWLDRLEKSCAPCVPRVARRLLVLCAAEGIDRIEISDRQLEPVIGVSRDYIRVAARNLETQIRISSTRRGRLWRMPPELLPPAPEMQIPFPETDGQPLLPVVENMAWSSRPQEGKSRPQVHLLSNYMARKPGQSNEEKAKRPGHFGKKTRPSARDWLRPPGHRPTESITSDSSGLALPSSGLVHQAAPPSNSSRILAGSAHSHAAHARSFDDPEPVEISPAHENAARIASVHYLEPHQRTDADQLAAALHSYMDEFGDSHRTEWRPLEAVKHDDEILARCLAVASLGSLLEYLRVMRNADFRGCASYGWFLTLFGEQFAAIPRKIMRAALSKEKRSHRQTPKPKPPAYETGEAPENQNTEFETLIHQVSSAAAGRKLQ
jgi:hypothetical protein